MAHDSTIDVTVILTLGDEGLRAEPSCRSLELAQDAAQAAGLGVEVLALLGPGGPAAAEWFSARAPAHWRRLAVDGGDAGAARNRGVAAAQGRWIAFLDADVLFDADWLRAACAAAQADSGPAVWHPEVKFYFGGAGFLLQIPDMERDGLGPAGAVAGCCWTAHCLAPKALLDQTPFAPIGPHGAAEQRGRWMRALAAAGARHKTVPGGRLFLRRDFWRDSGFVPDSALLWRATGAGPPPGATGLPR